MLGARIVTAVVLLAVLLPALFLFAPLVWGLVTLAFLSAAAYEWARLEGRARRGWVAAIGLALLGLAYAGWRAAGAGGSPAGGTGVGTAPPTWLVWPVALVCLFWLLEVPRRLRGARAQAGGLLVALPVLFVAWLAIYELRIAGIGILLSTMVLVWVADIAAYFVGRAFGRHKLAPSISPGKSWEGAFGGLAGVLALSAAVLAWPPAVDTLQGLLAQRIGVAGMLAVMAALTALSIVGDLFESRLKREAGVKDSGRILPGHGGVLDRIDALLPVLPFGLLLALLLG